MLGTVIFEDKIAKEVRILRGVAEEEAGEGPSLPC